MVPSCPVSRCQSPQFWWYRDVRSCVFSRPVSGTLYPRPHQVTFSGSQMALWPLVDGAWHTPSHQVRGQAQTWHKHPTHDMHLHAVQGCTNFGWRWAVIRYIIPVIYIYRSVVVGMALARPWVWCNNYNLKVSQTLHVSYEFLRIRRTWHDCDYLGECSVLRAL